MTYERDLRETPPEPGAWLIVSLMMSGEEVFWFKFRCPCGCGDVDCIPLDRQADGFSWQWDRNLESPTLSPSLLRRTCGWHGFFEAGLWNWCAESSIAAHCLHPGVQK